MVPLVPDVSAALQTLLERMHLASAEDLAELLHDVSPDVGAEEMVIHLVDYTQRVLVRFPAVGDAAADQLAVEGTLAGRAYRDGAIQQTGHDGEHVLWLPLLDGTERLGALKVVTREQPDEAAVRMGLTVAGLVAELITTRSAYGDAIERSRRLLPMSVAAELQWSLLPPLTYATPRGVISAVLEPCYDIGGDSFDYAVNGRVLHVALFDAVGHGIEAAQLVSLAMAAYRNARRSGLDLSDTATSVDRWVSQQFPNTFVTGVLLELDTVSGLTRVVNAGHPAPMVFRAARLVRTVEGPTHFPFGLGSPGAKEAVVAESLEPGDRVLLYSDGIAEARNADGEEFGVERLVDFVGRQLTAELPAPETLRRLIHQILEHQDDALQDDATAVLVEWSEEAPLRPLP